MISSWRTLSRIAWRSSAAGYRCREAVTTTSTCFTSGDFTKEPGLAATLAMLKKTTKRSYSQETDASAEESNEILCQTKGNVGMLILNRPQQMNALTTTLMRKMGQMLTTWIKEDKKTAIIIRGRDGKVFCAGGDLRLICESAMGKNDKARELFRIGYPKAIIINECPIPYCALIDGITMGAGIGISTSGRYRVSTERTVFAMPELNVGFYPESTATHFLPRLKGKLGHFLGLTAYRLTGADVYHAGVATHAVDSVNMASLEGDLCKVQAREDVKEVLDRYTKSAKFLEKPFSLAPYLEEIDDYFSAPTVEEIIHRMKKSGTDFANATLKRMSAAPPLSLKITKKAFDESITKTLTESLQTEFRITTRLAYHQNFVEGIRASLITKSGRPTWKPARLEDCTPEMVNSFFEPLAEDELVPDTF